MSALISPLLPSVAEPHSDDTPARNPFDRLSRMGISRVSSSSRGSDRAVT